MSLTWDIKLAIITIQNTNKGSCFNISTGKKIIRKEGDLSVRHQKMSSK